MKHTMNKTVPENGRILIVDDEEIVHQTIKRLLESDEYTIDSAYGGEKALNRLDAGYDLLICDVRMPDMDGIEVLREIRKSELDVEVLMITGYASLESATDSMNYGALGYIMKPIENIPEFRNKIREAMYTAQVTRENKEFYEAMISDMLDDEVRNLIRVIGDAIVILNSDCKITFANFAFSHMVGVPYRNLPGARFEAYIPEEEQDKLKEAFTRLSTIQNPVNIRTHLMTGFGRLLSVNIRCVPNIHEMKRQGVTMLISDVTEINQIRENMESLAYMVENAQYDMMFIVQPEGQIMKCNALARKTFGYTLDEMLSHNIGNLFKSDKEYEWKKIMGHIKRGLNWRGETMATGKDGKDFPIEMTVSGSYSRSDHDINIICFMRDITLWKKAEELRLENVRLSHASKE